MTRKLLKYAKKDNVSVINFSPSGECSLRQEHVPLYHRFFYENRSGKPDRMDQAVAKGKKIISVHGKKSSPAVIAHEWGHTSGNLAKGDVHYQPLYPEDDSRFMNLGRSCINWIGEGPRVREEKRASKAGLRLMKDLGASKELQKKSKQELKDALKTYKMQRRIDALRPIAEYADSSIVEDVAGNINSQLSQNTSKAINTVYRKGGRF